MTDEKMTEEKKTVSDSNSNADVEGPGWKMKHSEKADSGKELPAIDFSRFCLFMATSALIHLGESANPETNTTEVNLPLAHQTIDILAMLEEKTKVVQIKSLTEEIMDHIGTVYEQYGIKILTVEVKKLDLPDNNKNAVYTRMISERENIAAKYTAEGEAQAKMIQNTTDKEVSIMRSTAQAKGEKIRAEGEAEYMRILSEAYNDRSKSDFYSFVRSLDAAKESMKGSNKTLILPADSPMAEVFMSNTADTKNAPVYTPRDTDRSISTNSVN